MEILSGIVYFLYMAVIHLLAIIGGAMVFILIEQGRY